MSLLEEMMAQRRLSKNLAIRDGLANCRHCDGDYVDNQVIIIEDEKSCPHCKEPEHKTYYYQD